MNREHLVNTANKAANTKLGGPGSLGYQERVVGPVTEKLKGGSTLLMNGRPPLGEIESETEGKHEVMAKVCGQAEGAAEELDVLRLENGKYAIATTDREGQAVLTPLDEFGNKAIEFDIAGSRVGILFRPNNGDLAILPITHDVATEALELTFNN